MALAVVQTAMNLEKQSVHPFFTKPHRNITADTTEAPVEKLHEDPDYEQSETGTQKGGSKRGRKSGATKGKGKISLSKRSQASLDQFARPLHIEDTDNATVPATAHCIPGKAPLSEDTNEHRSKRRKTASPEPTLGGGSGIGRAQQPPASTGLGQLSESKEGNKDSWYKSSASETLNVGGPAELPMFGGNAGQLQQPGAILQDNTRTSELNVVPETETVTQAPGTSNTTPKKKLKLSKHGKLTSPRSSEPTPSCEAEQTSPKKRRRRQPKAKVLPTITVIKYGADAEGRRAFGEKIEKILNRVKIVPQPAPKRAPPKPTGPPKSTHPFFLGKPAPPKDEPMVDTAISHTQSPHRKSAVIPGKLKAENRSQDATIQNSGPVFGSNRAPKQMGLLESPWPTRTTAHVRNIDCASLPPLQSTMQSQLLKTRKMKGAISTIPTDNNIMATLARQLEKAIYTKCDLYASEFEPPKDVRLPTRLLTTGSKIQEQVRSHISAGATHPAIQSLFHDIEHTLTPFDLAKCESQSWTHKYAPQYTSHVLQAGNEAATLHDWLTSLTVMTVGGKAGTSRSASETKRPPKKKRKKEQDDFIVDSDEEEEEEMVELENGPGYKHSIVAPERPISFRRPRWTRNMNVVLISGPHGCGKSAMVYAVAKDLGFEVFEINSGSRRSGKDVQDKVGDMSENHLVNHKRSGTVSKQATVTPEDTDNERHSTALRDDLESGRQCTMTSFFGGSGVVKVKSKSKSKPSEPRTAPTSTQATLPVAQTRPKSQKQSLILFEEADNLFEDDQQFWAHVTRLAAQSKRPIIVTCNDESDIPTHELPLAAVLRLGPPPIDLATDYLLVLAGREGHILERDAVSSLYKSKDHDLRASITELNLWCQMSVGDRKGGLEWMIDRSKDIDHSGRALRVASQRTYQKGMGDVSLNLFRSTENNAFDKDAELLKQTWVDWEIMPSHWTSLGQNSPPATLANLKNLDALSESISAADIYSRIDLPSYGRHHEQPMDPSAPSLLDKERRNYIAHTSVLKVDHLQDYSQLDTRLFVQSHLFIQRAYGGRHICTGPDQHVIPATETDFTQAILQHKQEIQNMHRTALSRLDFSEAFDPVAYPPEAFPASNTSYNLTASSFDRTFDVVVEDLAPYVRSIVAHELVLEAQRVRLGNLLSEGGTGNKRQRTTRAARTALEGGNRETKRRERWFGQDLNRVSVMETAGKDWAGMGSVTQANLEDQEGPEKTGESAPSTQEEQGTTLLKSD